MLRSLQMNSTAETDDIRLKYMVQPESHIVYGNIENGNV